MFPQSNRSISCIDINKHFVDIFKLLAKYDNKDNDADTSNTSHCDTNLTTNCPKPPNKFDQLAVVFGTLLLNEKLLFKFCQNFEEHGENIGNMIYFKNTNFNHIYDHKLTKDEQNTIHNKLKSIYDLAQKELLNHNIPHNLIDDLADHDNLINEVLQNDQIKKLLGMNSNFNINHIKKFIENNKSQFENIEKFVQNNANLTIQSPQDIKSLFGTLFENNDLFKSISGLLNESMFTTMMQNVQEMCKNNSKGDNNDNNKKNNGSNNSNGDNNDDDNDNNNNGKEQEAMYKKILENIQARIKQDYPDVAEEIQKLIDIFNVDKVTDMFGNVQEKISEIDITNMQSVIEFLKKYIDENPSVQNVLWKLYMTLQSGLVNLQKMKDHGQVIIQIALEEFSASNIISGDDFNILSNLLFRGYFGKRKKTETKEQRQNRRIKSYRRKKRKEYKQQQLEHGSHNK